MISWYKKHYLAAKQRGDSQVFCPNCFYAFWPLAGRELTAWSDVRQLPVCPQCGQIFHRTRGASPEDLANPDGPFERPVDSRIEVTEENGTRLYRFPRYLDSPWWLYLAIVPNIAILAWVAYWLLTRDSYEEMFVLAVFNPILWMGLPMLICLLRGHYLTRELTLGPQTVRFRRSFILHRNFEVPVAAIDSVRKIWDGSTDGSPEFDIEIKAGRRRILIKVSLDDAEANWLCWEIREFAYQHGAPLKLDRHAVLDALCTLCQCRFHPVASQAPPDSTATVHDVSCPKCGNTASAPYVGVAAPAQDKPPSDVLKRAGSRIQTVMENGELVFRIPRGRFDGNLLVGGGRSSSSRC